jgi:hypothetical protein
MPLRTIDQAALVKSTGKSGNSCNMRANPLVPGHSEPEINARMAVSGVMVQVISLHISPCHVARRAKGE